MKALLTQQTQYQNHWYRSAAFSLLLLLTTVFSTQIKAYLGVYPTSITLGSAAGSTATISIASDESWSVGLKLNGYFYSISQSSGSGSAEITITALFDNHETSERFGQFSITTATETQWIQVTQLNTYLNISGTYHPLNSWAGESSIFGIYSNTTWTISEDVDWLDVSPTSGSNGATITVETTSENTSASIRSATVTIIGSDVPEKTVTVDQYGQGLGCLNETFTASFGTITDNSGSSDYGNMWSCQKLIQPPGVEYITLTFTEFEVWDGQDYVQVYDGATTSATLLGTYTGSTLPPVLTSSGGSMLITFTTNIDNIAPGWSADYVSGLSSNYLNVSTPDVIVSSGASSTGTFSISSNVSWNIIDDASWLTVSPTSGSNNGSITVTATENPGSGSRSAIITVIGTLVPPAKVTVTQLPPGDYLWEDKELDGFWWGGRYGHAMAYLGGDKIVSHGGKSGGFYLEDTDVYDLSDNSWEILSPPGYPSGRYCHAMASIGNNMVLLFGGVGDGAAVYGDTYLYNGTNNTWTQLSPATSPPARYDHDMVYMGGDKVMLFGGGENNTDQKNDTWIFDLSDNTWTQVFPASSPSGRTKHSMSELGDGKAILFGGWDGTRSSCLGGLFYYNIPNNETWIYDLGSNTWTQLNPDLKPRPLFGSAMAHLGGNKVVLFGGTQDDCGGPSSTSYDETWIFDGNTNTWTEYLGAIKPPAMGYHNLAETSANGGSVVLFGGYLGVSNVSPATWVFENLGALQFSVSPTSLTLGSSSGSTGDFDINSNVIWNITDDADWLSVLPTSGSNDGTITVTAISDNTGPGERTATVTVSGTGGLSETVTVSQEAGPPAGNTWGITEILGTTTTVANRRAVPVTASEDGTIESISIYHEGGGGGMLLGVYEDASGLPGAQLGVTPTTTVSGSAGWQMVSLSSPVSVGVGETVWLAWVFESNPGIRYETGTPGRANSPETWPGGMPTSFGSSTMGNYNYSIYCTYTPGVPTGGTWGNSEVFGTSTTVANRRAVPITASEAGSIESVSIYHEGGSGSLLLGVYSDASGSPSSRIGVTPTTTVSASAGWQTVSLSSPVSVGAGETVWLAWVFQTNPGIRYTTGTPGRANSPEVWAGGMPTSFGSSDIANYIYSIYCTYTTGVPTDYLDVSPTSFAIGSSSGSTGSFDISSNVSWSVTDDADWLSVSPTSGSNDGTATVTATSENTESSTRTATVTVTGGSIVRTVTVTQEAGSGGGSTLGNTDILGLTTTVANRRAVPITASEDGTIESISIYHEGGSGSLLLGVYEDASGLPGSRLGVTPTTTVSGSAGWQMVSLSSSVPVGAGETVWLAWVFESNPGIRYEMGTPGRANSPEVWSGGMPTSFGSSTMGNYNYSIYCTYTPGTTTSTWGYTGIFGTTTTVANRRAVPVTASEAGTIESISIYHEGGGGGLLLGLYSDASGLPGSRLGVTPTTAVSGSAGWQTVDLSSPVLVGAGETVWLAWVFESNPGIRYRTGYPGRASSPETWSGGMPSSFGSSTTADYFYSIYCTYAPSGPPAQYGWVNQNLDAFWWGGRFGHAMAYLEEDKIVMHGGCTESGGEYISLLDTDVYDISENSWVQYYPDPRPSARLRHSMAYIGNNRVLLYGGRENRTLTCAIYGDTWLFDGNSNTWTQLSPSTSPPVLYDHDMAWLGDDKVLLFGGGSLPDHSGYNNETWVFDLSSNTWTQMGPSSSPSARRNLSLARIGSGKVVMFGGTTGTTFCFLPHPSIPTTNGETWIYDLATDSWAQLSIAVRPEDRFSPSMAYLGGGKTMLFGGARTQCTPNYQYPLDDTWIFDSNTNTWSEYEGTPYPPYLMFHNLAETSESGGEIVLYGGSKDFLFSGTYLSKATWVYSGAAETAFSKKGADITLGMEEEEGDQFSIYPNPTSGELYISWDKEYEDGLIVTVVNSVGQTNMIIDVENGLRDVELDLSGYDPGMYYIILTDRKERSVVHRAKVIKSR